VLPDYDGELAAVQLDHAPQRKDADAADELLHQRGVEEGAAPLVEHAERCRRRNRLRVGPRRGQRIESVHDGGDRAHHADLRALEAVRIAAAVVPLVMQQRELGEPRRHIRGHAQNVR